MPIEDLSPKKLALLSRMLGREGIDSAILPITRLRRTGAPMPVSFAQEQLWILHRLEPESPAYNVHITLPVDPSARPETVERSLREIIRRHEVLRTVFPVVDGEPMQLVQDESAFTLESVDLQGFTDEARHSAFERLSREAAVAPFDLATGPLLRATLVRLSHEQQALLLTLHHIVTDGWSTGILIRELRALITAFAEGRSTPLPPLTVQYADFAAWQRALMTESRLEPGLAYWKRQLRGIAPLELPTDKRRPAMPGYQGRVESVLVDTALAESLKSLSRRAGVTLFITLLSAYKVLLSMQTGGTDDIVVGVPAANRERAEIQPLIGFFVNMLALRTSVARDESFLSLLSRVQSVVSDAFAHHEVPFEKIAAELAPDRDFSRHPVFQIIFNLLEEQRSGSGQDAPGAASMNGAVHTTRFDLETHVIERRDGLLVNFVYNTDLFDAASIRVLAEHYLQVLRAVVDDCEQRVADLQHARGDERHKVVTTWNATRNGYPQEASLPELFEHHAASRPDAIAVLWKDEQLTYGELNARANQVAHALRRAGVRVDSRVGVLLDRSLDLIVALLGIVKAGGAYVALDPLDPPSRIDALFSDSGVAVVLAPTGSLSEELNRFQLLDVTTTFDEPVTNLGVTIPPDAITYVGSTSGSTGRPKGVEVPQRGVVRLLFECDYATFGPDETLLSLAPISFDLSTLEIWGALLHGGKLVVYPERLPVPAELGEVLHQCGVTTMWLTVSLYNMVIEQAPDALSGLRQLLVGGEALSVPHILRGLASLPQTTLINGYGPTENTTFSACYTIPRDIPETVVSIPLGYPLANSQAYILNRDGEPAPVGVPGELCAGGDGLARCYSGMPRLTAERFVPDGVSGEHGARLYRTGDLARWRPDGTLEFLGRRDGQIKLRGFRIELGEIESALTALPEVTAAAAAVQELDGDKRLIAYVVTASGAALDVAGARVFLQQRLPAFMVPSAIVTLDALPLTASGKTDRRALPVPPRAAVAEDDATAPRTPLEETLARIWAGVLRLPTVGIHSNFFALGGDSILSIQVVTRALEAGVHFKPKHLFQHPTIAELAAVAVSVDAAAAADATPVTGLVPLTPMQRWFLEGESEEPHHFNQAIMVQLRDDVNVDVLRRTVDFLVSRHDMLRARYRRTMRGDWEQEIAPTETLTFSRLDLSSLNASDRRTAMLSESTKVQMTLDLEVGPLFRAVLFDFGGATPSRLLLVAHHLVVDGVSWRVLIDDLQSAYEQLLAGKTPQRPPITTSYLAWSQLLSDRARQLPADERNFWLREIAEPLTPPADKRRDSVPEEAPARASSVLDDAETAKILRDLPARLGVHVDEIVLSAFLRAFARASGRPSVWVDFERHGRNEDLGSADVSRTVGWFTSMFPVRFELAQEDDPQAHVNRVKHALRRVPDNGFGYGLLRYLGTDDDRKRLTEAGDAPISFNYLGQYDQLFSDEGAFQSASDPVGPTQSAKMRQRHPLDVIALVFGSQLRLELSYDRSVHSTEVVERMMQDFTQELRQLIRSCEERPAGAAAAAQSLPADVAIDRLRQKYADLQDVYRFTSLQHGMIFHSLLQEQAGLYVELFRCRLEGNLDIEAFKGAWHRVVQRHDVLRTVFTWDGADTPLQVVRRRLQPEWAEHDWRSTSANEHQRRISKVIATEERKGFDLAHGPLMRLTVMRLTENETEFVWAFHHVLLDGWSVALVLKEVSDAYNAMVAGQSPRFAPAVQFRKYVEWVGAQSRANAEAYWREMLQDVSSTTPLGLEKTTAIGDRQPDSRQQTIQVNPAVTARLTQAARALRVTTNTLLVGAWAFLLSRYSGQDDVVFGITASGRSPELPGSASMVGLCINTVPVRVRVPRTGPLGGWLRDLQAGQVRQRDHEHLGLTDIVKCSGVSAGAPLFESILVFENYPQADASHDSTRSLVARAADTRHRSNYPLALAATLGNTLTIRAVCDANRIDSETVSRLLQHLETVLTAIADGAHGAIDQLSLMNGAEQALVLAAAKGRAHAYPNNATLAELFLEAASRAGDAIAVEEGEIRWSYAETASRATQVARVLRASGVGPGVVVGLWLERGAPLIGALVGVSVAGGVYLPLEPSLPDARAAGMLADAGAVVVLTTASLASSVPSGPWQIVTLEETSTVSDAPIAPQGNADDWAYIIYTSGSTGRPKGVAVPQRAIARLVCGPDYVELGKDTVMAQAATPAFDAATFEIWGALLNGGRLVIYPQRLPIASELDGFIRKHGITTMWLTAALYNTVVDQAPQALNGLRQLLVGGEALSVPHIRRGLASLPQTTLINGYGPTENTTFSACYTIPRDTPETSVSIPLGGPIAHTDAYVLDHAGALAAIGVVGELYLGGAGLAHGYVGSTRLTADRFVPDGVSGTGGARLYRTGDLVKWREPGVLEFLGRRDGQLKLRGYRIELGEIEAALSAADGVGSAVAMIRGEGVERELIAYVAPAAGATLDGNTVREALKRRLPGYMVPAIVTVLDSLPLNSNGKIDRGALPQIGERQSTTEFSAPDTATERTIADVWREVLRVDRVGTQDDFLELGGHSLLATQVVSRLRTALKLDIPLASLFAHTNLADLARSIDAMRRPDQPGDETAIAADRSTEHAVSASQQRLWFLDQLSPGSTAYNVPSAMRIDGPLDAGALERAISEIVRRHEVLRTAFVSVAGTPRAMVREFQPFSIARIDLRAMYGPAQEREISRLVDEEVMTPFDLSQAPLIRGRLLQLSDSEHVFVIVLHHIVCDAWSLQVLVRELMAFYDSFAAGSPANIAPLQFQYSDFAEWQRRELRGEKVAAELDYWSQQLKSVGVLDLPLDRQRPPSQTFTGGCHRARLSASCLDALRSLAQQERSTLFMTLLAAFDVLLSRYTNQTDIAVGTPITHRPLKEVEPLIGFFSNTVVMRTQLAPGASYRAILRRVRDVAIDAYDHQNVPFEQVVERLQPDRHLDRHPLFQVLFTFQHSPARAFGLSGVNLRPLDVQRISVRFDLELHVAETSDGLVTAFYYNSDLFDSATIARMSAQFETLVDSIVAEPDRPFEELDLLPSDEVKQLRLWNSTLRPMRNGPTVHHMFELRAERTPDLTAVEFHNVHLTYEQLNAKANQVAHCLRALGVGPEDRVAIAVERCLGLMVCVLGVLKAGAAYVPLDVSYPSERLRYMLRDSRAKVLLTQEHLLSGLEGSTGRRRKSTTSRGAHKPAVLCIDRDWDTIAAQADHDPMPTAGPDNLAYVLYTSGSTGRPKGVAMPHRPLNNLLSWQLDASEDRAAGRTVQYAPLSFDPSFLEMFSTWSAGGTVVLVEDEVRRDFMALLRFMDSHMIERIYITPAALHQLAEASESSRIVPRSLREVNAAGERLEITPQIARLFAELDGCVLFNQYGPTETHVATAELIAGDPQEWGALPSIGKALPNTRLYVLDPRGRRVPIGVPGDLYIGGECVARCYLDNPRLTAERFVVDPALDGIGGRLYRTGDIVRFKHDGRLEYLGRADDQVKLRGYRIELGEIEAVLAQDPAVLDAAAAVHTSASGRKQLVAYVVPRPDRSIKTPQLRTHLLKFLPEYMVPGVFEVLDKLPMTPSGKIDRGALPVPTSLHDSEDSYVPPRNAVEEKMASIWAESLGVVRVGINDNFFALGGHSLLASQVISHVRREWGVELPVRAMFESPTVAGLTDRLETILWISGPAVGAGSSRAEREEGQL